MIKWTYEPDKENTVRYTLGIRGVRTLYCFGINPSTATPEKLDPTVNRVSQIADAQGYDGWMMFNIYPKRETIFQNLYKYRDDEIHLKNVAAVRQCVAEDLNQEVFIWAAWGNLILGKEYLCDCFADILSALPKEKKIRWLCAGMNKNGTPKHPLYLPKASVLVPFDMDTHIENLRLSEKKRNKNKTRTAQ